MLGRSLVLLPILAAMTACSGGAPSPDDEGDDVVATETTESAVRVTDTPGKAVWTKLWRWSTDARPTMASDVATDFAGSQYLLRGFGNSDGSTTQTPVIQSMDVTRYSATGEIVFRTSFGASDVSLYSPRLGAGNGRVAAVSTQVVSNLPYSPRTLIQVVDTATGNFLFERVVHAERTEWTENGEQHVSNGSVRATAVAVGRDGEIVIVGDVHGDADLGAGMMRDPDPSHEDGFLLGLDRNGGVRYAKRFEAVRMNGVDLDAEGSVYVAHNGKLTTPAGPEPVVSKFSGAGALVRSSAFSTTGVASFQKIAVSAGGRVALGGTFTQSLNLGDITLVDKYKNKFGEAFFAKLDPEGTPVFGRTISGNARRTIVGVGIDSYGQVVGTLNFQGTAETNGRSFTTDDGDDVDNLLVKYTAVSGDQMWATRYLGTGAVHNEVTATGLSITTSDRIVMSGIFRKNVDFGRGVITGSLAGNGFLTRFYQ